MDTEAVQQCTQNPLPALRRWLSRWHHVCPGAVWRPRCAARRTTDATRRTPDATRCTEPDQTLDNQTPAEAELRSRQRWHGSRRRSPSP
eukprot:9026761-Lingulodinium_polyedra.AAC.1